MLVEDLPHIGEQIGVPRLVGDSGALHTVRLPNALQRNAFPHDGWQIGAVNTAHTINGVPTASDMP